MVQSKKHSGGIKTQRKTTITSHKTQNRIPSPPSIQVHACQHAATGENTLKQIAKSCPANGSRMYLGIHSRTTSPVESISYPNPSTYYSIRIQLSDNRQDLAGKWHQRHKSQHVRKLIQCRHENSRNPMLPGLLANIPTFPIFLPS